MRESKTWQIFTRSARLSTPHYGSKGQEDRQAQHNQYHLGTLGYNILVQILLIYIFGTLLRALLRITWNHSFSIVIGIAQVDTDIDTDVTAKI